MVLGMVAIFVEILDARNPSRASGQIGSLLFMAVVGCLLLFAGFGLRRLNRVARHLATFFAGISLLYFGIGLASILYMALDSGSIQSDLLVLAVVVPVVTLFMVINGYIMYLLRCAKSSVVFSQAYKDAIRETPHIKYRTSIVVKLLGGLVLLFILFGAISTFFGL